MIPIALAFYLAALACFILGAFPVNSRVNLVSLGLAFAMGGYLAGRFA